MIRVILCALAIMLFSITYSQQVGKASYYAEQHNGRKTASGEVFNMNGLTAASNTHPLGTMLRVTNLKNNKSVVVKVNDRGGFGKLGRIIDLSKGAFAQIASVKQGIITVMVEILSN